MKPSYFDLGHCDSAQTTPVHLFVCAHFVAETRAALAAAPELSHLRVHGFRPRCQRPPLDHDGLSTGAGAAAVPGGEAAAWIGGACMHALRARAQGSVQGEGSQALIETLPQCFHLLADPERVDAALQDGRYLCSPSWLANWRKHLDALGLADPELAKALFADSATGILLLDTGTEDAIETELNAFSTHVGLPAVRERVGLGYLRLQLTRVAAQAALRHEQCQNRARVVEARAQAAEAAMAMDLLSELSAATDRADLIRRVLDVFNVLFAPAQVFYLWLHRPDDDASEVLTVDAPKRADPALVAEARRFAEAGIDTVETQSGAGFMLRFQSLRQPLGVFVLEGFAQPRHRTRYHNLALQMRGVCALALARAEALEELSRSEARYRSLFSSMHEGFAVHRVLRSDDMGVRRYRLFDLNPAFAEMVGEPRDVLIGQCPERAAPALSALYLERCAEVVRTGRPLHFEAASAADARVFDIYAYRPMVGWLAVILSDITERRTAEAQVRHLAHHDPLTGLANRLVLEQRATRLLAEAATDRDRVGLLFCDLDYFKAVNDNLGHAAGDELLQEVARRLRSVVRQSDTVARIGGDEFVVLLAGAGRADACAIADELLAVLNQPFELCGESLRPGGSVGIGLYPDHGSDFATLLRAADKALYAAKEQGRGRTCCCADAGLPPRAPSLAGARLGRH